MDDEIQQKLEELERKREELVRALEARQVADPVTAAFAAIFTIKGLVAIGVSVGVSFALGQITRALTPAQKFTQGVRDGKIDFPNALPGGPISEIYGGRPATAGFQASHAYALNDNVLVGDSYFKVTTAGTSAGSAPTWPSTKGSTVTSGTATFTHMGGNAGGAMAPANFLWSGGIDKHTSTTQQGGGKGFGPKPAEVTTITYSTDIAVLWGRGPLEQRVIFAATDKLLDLRATLTGILDPTVLPDTDYDPTLPPDPDPDYVRPVQRYSGAEVVDGEGVGTGVVSVGGANFANYPGNQTQLPDPTIEADVDARHGNDSTPAFRGRSYSVLNGFFLTRYGGAVPPFSSVSENTSYKTLAQIFGQWCDRTGVLLSSDYDFSDVASLDVRGLAITPKYRPREPMEVLARIFNVVFSESDKIYALRKGVGSVVATVDDSEMGWVSADREPDEGPLQELDTTLQPETSIVRKVEFRYVNPEKDFEPDESHHQRQITDAKGSETIELQLTMYPDEAKAVTQREVYEAELKSQAHRTTLSWEYLWVKAGNEITITRDEGFTQRVRVVRIVHNIGPIEVEFEPVEASVYVQPVEAPEGVFEIPPVPIPAMSILGLYDGPLFRDNENTTNNGAGMYVYALKRTGDGAWNGAVLYVDRGLGYEQVESFEAQATAGRTASGSSGVLTGTTSTSGIVADTVTVDLYGAEGELEGATDEELWAGANHCLIGDEICQIKSATVVGGFNNRWNLVIGLRARRGTEFAVETHQAGERFLLLNSAVKFVPLPLSDLNVEREYRLVTSGQSLDDAATVEFTWTGAGLKPLAAVHGSKQNDSANNSLIEFDWRERLGHGVHNGMSGFGDYLEKRGEIDIYSNSTRTTVVDTLPVLPASTPQNAVLISDRPSKFSGISTNTVTTASNEQLNVRALQQIRNWAYENFVEATLSINVAAGGRAAIGFFRPGAAWKMVGSDGTPLTYSALYDYLVVLQTSLGSPVLNIYENGSLAATLTTADGVAAATRVHLSISGAGVRVFVDYVGPQTPALYESPVPPRYPYYVGGVLDEASGGSTVSISDVILTTNPDPKIIYLADRQTEKGLTPGATIYADLYEIDSRVGRGYPAELTL